MKNYIKKTIGLKGLFILSILSVFFFFGIFGNISFAVSLHPTARDLPLNLVTRQQRGAEDSLMLTDSVGYQSILRKLNTSKEKLAKLKKTNFDAWLKKKAEIYRENKSEEQKTTFLLEKFSEQFYIDYTVKSLYDKELRWPWSYHDDKKAIIIHHTADYTELSSMNSKSEIEMMQKIFKYHTISRGWGDIGYNFVIGPSGKIYEGRAGGPGVIGAHAKYNNSFTLGIALMGNFNNQKPTQSQLDSLTKLITELTYQYNIDPNKEVTFHRKDKNNLLDNPIHSSIIGHTDAGWTSCPGKNLHNKLAGIRKTVTKNLEQRPKKRTDNVQVGWKPSQDSFFDKDFGSGYVKILKKKYLSNHTFKTATNLTVKPLVNKNKIEELKTKKVKVLLRELSLNKDELKFECENDCVLWTNGNKLKTTLSKINIKKTQNYIVWSIGKYKVPVKSMMISDSKGGIIKVTNYDRKSYFGVARNEFRGDIKIQKEKISDKKTDSHFNGKDEISIFTIVNELGLENYLEGIVETNDNERFEKNKVMAILAKNYIIHYLDSANQHPNIPEGVNYNAIDDPDYFQKYVGAGLDKTLKMRKNALALTKDQFIIFEEGDGKFKTKKLAFTPYFSCSPGFTRDAIKKFGRTNLPYLSSRLDFVKCDSFQGHGVGLSGKGANTLAKKGMNYTDIIRYYYPGVIIESL